MLNLDPSCKLVEVTAMRECAFVGADPEVRTRQGNAAERERAEIVGPRPLRPINYMFLSVRSSPQHLPFHSEANSTLDNIFIFGKVIWNCWNISSRCTSPFLAWTETFGTQLSRISPMNHSIGTKGPSQWLKAHCDHLYFYYKLDKA